MAQYLFLVISLSFGVAASLSSSGSINRPDKMMYMFDPVVMDKYEKYIQYEMMIPKTHSQMVLAVYNESSVTHIYDSSLDCYQKINKAWPHVYSASDCPVEVEAYKDEMYRCLGNIKVVGVPGAEYYVVLFNCQEGGIVVKSYSLYDTDYPETVSGSTQVYSTLWLILAAVVAFL